MSRSELPTISIGMPVYNGAEYIAEAIESVLAQTYKNFHLTICDNCSSDATETIVKNHRDTRISYVRHAENIGIVNNANSCLNLATGDYCYIFHHDDIMLPTNIERKVDLLEANADIGFVHSNFMLIDSNGKVISDNTWDQASRRDYIEDGTIAFLNYLEKFPFGASYFIGSVMARRSCYQKVGWFNPKFPHCHDSEMWLRMLLNYNVACIGEPLLKYRVHQMSTSTGWGDFKSAPYLKEHYETAKAIFENQREKIAHPDKLSKQVYFSFAERALQLGTASLRNRDFAGGRSFLITATQMSPGIAKKGKFWKALVKIVLNDGGLDFYYSLKKKIKRNHNA